MYFEDIKAKMIAEIDSSFHGRWSGQAKWKIFFREKKWAFLLDEIKKYASTWGMKLVVV